MTDISDERLAELIRDWYADPDIDIVLRELVRHREDAKRRRAGAGEPVAWRRRFGGNDWQLSEREPALLAGWVKEPLYAHPPAAPDAEREECARQCEAAGHDERLADGGLYLRAARLLRATDADRREKS